MELIINNNPQSMIQDKSTDESPSSSFIEANTVKVSLQHLRDDCIIPVFSKDNESTISHYQFIREAQNVLEGIYNGYEIRPPEIRVSHIVKGRVPSAIGKPAKELLDNEKTIYYERCAFMIEIPEVYEVINGNRLTLSIGGVRSLSQENLYSKKSPEKFKLFIGMKNRVCTNLSISTDGLMDDIRVSSIIDLEDHIKYLLESYNRVEHLDILKEMGSYCLNQEQFAHLIGKMKLYHYLDRDERQGLFELQTTESQINNIVKNYVQDDHFCADNDGGINLWNLYNLFTESSKSNYIDNFLNRNCNTYEFVNHLSNSLKNHEDNYFLNKYDVVL
ncbi:DUF3871 family protein [Aestuariivivens sediminicola]|uniref:DUF3871 family protein n=1 Tax=Aestuariivivens sediminicola TaxID=2913560 RepID=UPI001F5A5C03|nr:DUF3871 family protein [Aestuariivivens sediminicola]